MTSRLLFLTLAMSVILAVAGWLAPASAAEPCGARHAGDAHFARMVSPNVSEAVHGLHSSAVLDDDDNGLNASVLPTPNDIVAALYDGNGCDACGPLPPVAVLRSRTCPPGDRPPQDA